MREFAFSNFQLARVRCELGVEYPTVEHAQRLLATGDSEIVEWNSWHDRAWGRCTCERCGGKGQNLLGQALMQVRAELREAA